MKKGMNLILLLSALFLSACAKSAEVPDTPTPTPTPIVETVLIDGKETTVYTDANGVQTTVVEKEPLVEKNLNDNAELYVGSEENADQVVTMYLTVSTGNSGDSSNHTWEEINSHSTTYYANLGVERYKVEGILQIDDTGEGLNENSFGYNAVVPNVIVQVRGQTSSESRYKSYKVRIKYGMGLYNGQRTLALNKHRQEQYRFLNKLCYDLASEVPQLIGMRTQFVHLFVKDLTSGEEDPQFEDYGLFTMVEQGNHRYLKARNLDENGQFYKVTFFEWEPYAAIMNATADDEDYSEFETYMEIKGNKDPTKIQNVITQLNNYLIPIDDIIEQYFDAENLVYFFAFHILIGNTDVGARNLYIYSPQNSERFYLTNWDLDQTFVANYHQWYKYSVLGTNWERGFTLFTGLRLYSRMMKQQKYRDMLTAAVQDLRENYLTDEHVTELVEKYRSIVEPYLYGGPDEKTAMLADKAVYDDLVDKLPSEVADNYDIYMESLHWPWPFYGGVPTREGNNLIFNWGNSYDPNNESVTYHVQIASDQAFENVIYEADGLEIAMYTAPMLDPGTYFMRVTATNESGYSMGLFDWYELKEEEAIDGYWGKVYNCYGFTISETGVIKSTAEE